MKTLAGILCAWLLAGLAWNANAADKLQHVVCFKFKSTASAQDIKKVETAFEGLKKSIPQITAFEWGTNVSKEKHDKGFTHCYILTFKSEKDRDTYIDHPEHKAFGKIVGPVLEDVFVIDFWAK
ncbi:MAG TPA: Dabb family protein [Clostridia bacterium]|nr:Dabb family protein [Clostridia bacterium]